MEGVVIRQISWHRQYGPIRKIRKAAPCIGIVVAGGKVSGLSMLDAKYDQILRKYGSKHGSYPCMNLAPLYRITDEKTQKALTEIEKHPEKIDAACVEQMKAWCTATNWGKKFQDKYKICMVDKPLELQKAALCYRPLQILMEETKPFADAEKLHSAIAERAWTMLTDRTNTETALKVLFYRVPKSKREEANYGSISVAFDCEQLIEEGIPAISERFVQGLNQCLRDIDEAVYAVQQADSIDAFGIPFQALEEPMPNVKLAGGFDVTLRTMFRNQYCQTRYGKIGNASYPISPGMRSELKDALEWLGAAEQKDKTWINIDQKEILFAYPVAMPKPTLSYTKMFKRSANQEASFLNLAKEFVQELRQTREAGMDSHAKGIRIFVLKQVKKACTKIVYTCQTDPDELERFSEAWTQGCANLPSFQFGDPATLFPVDVADVLNRFWNRSLKQDGKAVTEKFKPFSRYRGIELLMDPERSTKAEMHRLAENAMNSGPFFGSLSAKGNLTHTAWEKAKDMLALMGLLLDREHVRKEGYMENHAVLFMGEKLSAERH